MVFSFSIRTKNTILDHKNKAVTTKGFNLSESSLGFPELSRTQSKKENNKGALSKRIFQSNLQRKHFINTKEGKLISRADCPVLLGF